MSSTLRDVALRAGVSTSTVSRVLHDSARISDETKTRVRKAMTELQYRPHAIARSLASRSTRTLGLVLPSDPDDLFLNSFFIQAMRGLSIYAQEHGYHLTYAFSRDEQAEVQFIRDYVDSKRVDGVVLLTARQDDRCIAYLKARGFPFVAIGRPDDPADAFWVDNDNFQATYDVVNRLIMQGHKTIAFAGGPLVFNVTRHRRDGYRRAMQNRGLQVRDDLVCDAPSFTEQSGYETAMRILSIADVDAIVTTDDILAFGALRATSETGRPDVAVSGFNNTVRGQYQSPTLTTVDIRPEELGARAARLLTDVLEGTELPTNHYVVDTRLIERDSTLKRRWEDRRARDRDEGE